MLMMSQEQTQKNNVHFSSTSPHTQYDMESLHQLFFSHGWYILNTNHKNSNNITYIKSGCDLDFFDICFHENSCKIVVTIPIKNITCQYKCTFYNYFDAADYIEKRFYDYVR